MGEDKNVRRVQEAFNYNCMLNFEHSAEMSERLAGFARLLIDTEMGNTDLVSQAMRMHHDLVPDLEDKRSLLRWYYRHVIESQKDHERLLKMRDNLGALFQKAHAAEDQASICSVKEGVMTLNAHPLDLSQDEQELMLVMDDLIEEQGRYCIGLENGG